MAEDKEIVLTDENVVPSAEETVKPAPKKRTKKAEVSDSAAPEEKLAPKKTAKKVSEPKAVEETAVVSETVEKKPSVKKTTAKKSVTPEEEKAEASKASAEPEVAAIKAQSSPKPEKQPEEVIVIRLKHGFSGRLNNQIATAVSLGLRKIGDTVTQPKNAATLGKIAKISHMVEILNR